MTISELEDYFKTAEKPKTPLLLNPATVINNYEHFLESHFAPLRKDPESRVNQPFTLAIKGYEIIDRIECLIFSDLAHNIHKQLTFNNYF